MLKRALMLACIALFWATSSFPQGLDTPASKESWEEINFEFDSAVLVDGFPSLLRLAELLNQHSDYRVTLEGHADYRGTDQYNTRLSQGRAETVKAFLLKYGAREAQVSLTPRGEGSPRVSATSPEALFMNRRVVIILADGQGRTVSAGSVGQAINAIEEATKKQEDCCNRIMSELSKLDQILELLKQLKGENEQLKQDVAELKQKQGGLEKNVTEIAAAPKPPTREEVQEDVKKTVTESVQAALPPASKKFSILNLNVGPDTQDGNLSASGKGRVFLPFGGRHALQAEGEFMHYFGRDEGQVDIGLVYRFGNVQAGIFTSFKHVRLDEFQSGGSLGQASATLDYVFNRGRVGIFGTKGFMDGGVLNRVNVRPNTIEESYLSIVDQFGFSTAVAAWGDSWFEGNVGTLFREGGDKKAGGSIRYIHPLTRSIAFTAEAGVNETLISNDNSGRVVVGLQFGGWLSPKDYATDTASPVPVEIPRVRYEVLTRRVRTGNDSPVADAGPDRSGVEAGTVTLDGSASFDPDGDPITFTWEQIGGPAVQLSGAGTAKATFTAAEGETYHFRLTVRDDRNGAGIDRVTVTALDQQITITQFTASPLSVKSGDSVGLVWAIQNAEEAEINGVGGVNATGGSTTVTVNQTTTFTLTARNSKRSVSQSVTVTVAPPEAPRIVRFEATPSRVVAGQQTTLVWNVENATTVTISGIGNVSPSGSSSVQVNESTTYTLTARNEGGEVTATAAVTVASQGVRIINFTIDPPVVANPGDPATLRWETENATKVTITGVGEVEPSGSIVVNPVTVTTYNLLASDGFSQVQAVVIAKVENPNHSPIAIASAPFWFISAETTGFGQLNGSRSKDPDGDPITYEWRSVGPKEARVVNPNAQNPTVEFLDGYGQYNFELVVVDDKGARSSPDGAKTLFVGPPLPAQ